MLSQLLLVLITAGPAAPQSQSVEITAKTFVAPGRSEAARGDARTDDTEALQAAIGYAVEHKVPLRLEPGVYMISRTLEIESSGSGSYGFRMSGAGGPNRSGASQRGGVTICLQRNATDQEAVLRVGHADFLDMEISDVGLLSLVPNNATRYGLLFSGGKFSHAIVSNVAVSTVDTAFGVVPGGPNEGNGEGVDLTECTGNYVNCFYSNTSGQAYCHHVVNCSASVRNGGTCFKIGSGNLGFSLDVFGMMSTLLPGPERNTYIENDGISGTANFIGGRAEHVDTVLGYIGGSYNDMGIFAVKGMEFTEYTGRYPFLDGTLSQHGNAQWTNSFEDCRFDGRVGGNPAMRLEPQGGDVSRNIFSRCVFSGFGSVFPEAESRVMGVVLHDCRADRPNDHRLYDLG